MHRVPRYHLAAVLRLPCTPARHDTPHSPVRKRRSRSRLLAFLSGAGRRFRAHRLLVAALDMRHLVVVASFLLLAAAAGAQASRRCGDDVDGRGTRVPCACGDIVVSSYTLAPDDPLVQAPCPGDGLLIDMREPATAPALRLSGQRVRGTGRGIGIHLVRGGDTGLFLEGPGSVEGFRTGISAAAGALARAAQVVADGNLGDGFVAAGRGFTVESCEASHNGRHGFVLRGSSLVLRGNRAVENGANGFEIAARDSTLGAAEGNDARANGKAGVAVRGDRNDVRGIRALGNGGTGVRARLTRSRVVDSTTAANGGDGIRAAGRDTVVGTPGDASVVLRGRRVQALPVEGSR